MCDRMFDAVGRAVRGVASAVQAARANASLAIGAAMDLDMYVTSGTPTTDVASATRVRRRSDTDDRDDESRRRARPRVESPRASLMARLLLRVVTLCSGIEAVIQGYENLRVPHDHVAACDNNTHVQQMLRRNFSPNIIFPDLMRLKNSEMPTCDMLWAGFPCQPFSAEGRNAGRTGETHTFILCFIKSTCQ